MKADIGLIGLGVMGANLALNIAEKGFRVAVYNRTWDRTEKFMEDAGDLSDKIIACRTMADLADAISIPRPVIILVKAGEAVDEQIASLREVLAPDDIIIDSGNAQFQDTIQRGKALDGSGFNFIGMGISGGEYGARHGPSIMVGGPQACYRRVEKILTAIAAKYKKQPCCAWMGTDGAGHFVKMVHNGIEYADMQMIAEIYGIMRDGMRMKAPEISATFAKWNRGKLNSYLIEITAKVLARQDARTKKPMVDVILDRAGQKGTGKWSVIAAQELGVPATAMEAAVSARVLSSMKAERQAAEQAYGAARRSITVSHKASYIRQLESGLYAAKIAAYAQGFAVLQEASGHYGWNLPLATIASIWREGCIIRSRFLDLITTSFGKEKEPHNLLLAADFREIMARDHRALRKTVSDCALSGQPAPALSSALAYFDTYRQGRGTANLIQAQRDFFGAHTFERVDMTGSFHEVWE